ncbi:aminotransferase class V-fold PLP-dependent enzyme [Shouchella lonarensis]|uniref:cysteine desulfurase n=1 Tax=Shouchella lonarensis TaxID=1464122 RepID=A0A1G6NNF4_9BACI|nr:aminotransferase class V-fold PLP-dependent enzyme [Shouchella lonarensis]SDC69279.1 cysteine desulfurase family protein [Shouchella lonarensis]
MYYFDQAASSFPKPAAVVRAVEQSLRHYGANPGRGQHQLARQAAQIVSDTRNEVAALFRAPSPCHVWFYPNATYALNQAIGGFPFVPGDEVVTMSFQHNAVRRPLQMLIKNKGIKVHIVSTLNEGSICQETVVKAINEKTKMVIVSHASNVTGALFPLHDVSQKVKQVGAVLLVDAAQTAGVIDINIEQEEIDLLACPGHKGLLGPQGVGMLVSGRDVGLEPFVYGGTGHDSEGLYQPLEWPDRYEAGTLNTPGIAGLGAALKEIKNIGIKHIFTHESAMMEQFLNGLKDIPKIKVVGLAPREQRVAVVSFFIENVMSQEVALILDQHYQIAVRAGLHCAPELHQRFGTTQTGLVRVSFGLYTTENDVLVLLNALQEISAAF